MLEGLESRTQVTIREHQRLACIRTWGYAVQKQPLEDSISRYTLARSFLLCKLNDAEIRSRYDSCYLCGRQLLGLFDHNSAP